MNNNEMIRKINKSEKDIVKVNEQLDTIVLKNNDIQTYINKHNFINLTGNIEITTPILVKSGTTIKGSGRNNCMLLVKNGVNAFEFEENARNVYISDLTIQCENNSNIGNAIDFNSVKGGAGHCLERLIVNGFDKGINIGSFFFSNTFKDIRFNSNNTDIYGNGNNGTFNNRFEKIYSNQPKTCGISLTGCGSSTFDDLNMGTKGSRCIELGYGCYSTIIRNANIENDGVPFKNGHSNIWIKSSGSFIFDNVCFTNSSVESGANCYEFEIWGSGNADITLQNCYTVRQNENMKNIKFKFDGANIKNLNSPHFETKIDRFDGALTTCINQQNYFIKKIGKVTGATINTPISTGIDGRDINDILVFPTAKQNAVSDWHLECYGKYTNGNFYVKARKISDGSIATSSDVFDITYIVI